MQMRKGNEGQGTARSASKTPGKKPSDEQASPGDQNTAAKETSQGTAAGQSTAANQGSGGAQGTSGQQGTPGQQGTSGQQGTPGQQGKSNQQGKSGQQGTSGQQGQQAGGDQDLLQHAKHATGEIVNQVQQRAGSQLNRQKESAASELSQVANAVRRIRETLGGEESGAIVRYAAEYGDKAANSIERLSNYIREQDPKQLLDDVQRFGRRRPALLIGGAFLLGFAGARLIKSSMDAASQQQSYRGTNVPSSRPSTAPNAI